MGRTSTILTLLPDVKQKKDRIVTGNWGNYSLSSILACSLNPTNNSNIRTFLMKLIALFLPCVYFFITGNLIRSVIAFCLMASLVGWIFASIWAVSHRTDTMING
ncbi:hypothetical protein [Leptospira noguchii]|uniref:hypothetical protein n=1 Tax=Leptospira noguchii TaxID=28182 RepID=UPI0009BD6B2B|nr:hypothetical protein [Leptospira noguchii]